MVKIPNTHRLSSLERRALAACQVLTKQLMVIRIAKIKGGKK